MRQTHRDQCAAYARRETYVRPNSRLGPSHREEGLRPLRADSRRLWAGTAAMCDLQKATMLFMSAYGPSALRTGHPSRRAGDGPQLVSPWTFDACEGLLPNVSAPGGAGSRQDQTQTARSVGQGTCDRLWPSECQTPARRAAEGADTGLARYWTARVVRYRVVGSAHLYFPV